MEGSALITEYTTVEDMMYPTPAPEVKESRILKALNLLIPILLVVFIVTYNVALIFIAFMLVIGAVVYRNYLQSSYLKMGSHVVLETIHHKDRVWREQRRIQSVTPLIADQEIPDALKMHSYAVADDGGLTYYLSPIPWEDIIRERHEIDTAGGKVEGMATLIHTQVIGARYDPDRDEIIPMKRILHTLPVMTASGESVVDVYGTVQYNDYEAILTKSLQDELQGMLTIREETDHQLSALLVDADRKARELATHEFTKGITYDRGTVSTGWARLNILPPKPKVVRRDEVTIGYKCFHCNGTLKDTSTIARNGDIGLHFICAYCGSVNQVEEVAR